MQTPPPCLPQAKKTYEKIGESTEVALKVLAEKLNVQGLDRSAMTAHERAAAVCKTVTQEHKKVGQCGVYVLHNLRESADCASAYWIAYSS